MPAKSKQQQRFMGLVRAYQKGKVPSSKVGKSVKKAAGTMNARMLKILHQQNIEVYQKR